MEQDSFPVTGFSRYVYLDPINSELGLRHFARKTVKNPVQTLIGKIYKDKQLRHQLQLLGVMTFESHTNLGKQSETAVAEAIKDMSLIETVPSRSRAIARKVDRRGQTSSGGGTSGKEAGSAE